MSESGLYNGANYYTVGHIAPRESVRIPLYRRRRKVLMLIKPPIPGQGPFSFPFSQINTGSVVGQVGVGSVVDQVGVGGVLEQVGVGDVIGQVGTGSVIGQLVPDNN